MNETTQKLKNDAVKTAISDYLAARDTLGGMMARLYELAADVDPEFIVKSLPNDLIGSLREEVKETPRPFEDYFRVEGVSVRREDWPAYLRGKKLRDKLLYIGHWRLHLYFEMVDLEREERG